jgi:nitrite reductase/ring-hydroxylating ferredoxin subunit
MLSTADNELLVRTGPGTPMGDLFRRFWSPVMLAGDLGGPDSAPVRVTILGEQLVAFRDTAGSVGLLSAYCPHRRANLYWGRNEEHGLRCVYHGWKFDVNGQCTDLPNCPEGATLKDRVTTTAYPALERGGIVWAYLGPPERMPVFPRVEVLHTPASHRHIMKIVVHANYLQALEGDMDLGHTSFLHSRHDKNTSAGMHFLHSKVDKTAVFEDKTPHFFITETDYGAMHGVRRNAADDKYHWRVGQYLMPAHNLIASQRGGMILSNIRIPIDDESSLLFRCFVQPERPLDDDDRAVISAGVMAPQMIPGTPMMNENRDNGYLRDHDRQRTENFTGIRSIVAQDAAMTEDQGGPIFDRSREYLVSSDRVTIGLRKKLLGRVNDLIAGTEPPEAANPDAYAVRGIDVFLPRDVPIEDGIKDLIRVQVLAR